MKPIIEIQSVGKKYKIGLHRGYLSLREQLTSKSKTAIESFIKGKVNSGEDTDEFWALRDVSFSVNEGEVVGIIGRNGAGKSTLLKILSKITPPTIGRIVLRGRVASLLEVGTGFHPELTGRENIYLNGTILGMTRAEIKTKFDEIVAFSEIEQFLDTPVKRYSSGMYVRLAFAVAAHLEPEILLVDEVLAVGDVEFQKKCLGKMGDVAHAGRTVLFVSHNMTAMQSLCERAVWLNDGRVMQTGPASEIVSHYLRNGAQSVLERVWDTPDTAPGNEKVRLYSVHVEYDNAGGHNLTVAMPIDMIFEFWNLEDDAMLNCSVVLYNANDVCIFNSVSDACKYKKGLIRSVCSIPANLLNDAIYRIRLLIVKDQSTALLDLYDLAVFEVHDVEREGNWFGKWIGAVRPALTWNSTQVKGE